MPRSSFAEPLAHPDYMPLWRAALLARAALEQQKNTAPFIEAAKREQPKSLTIRFSRASDLEQVVDLYSGPMKEVIDPKNFVRPRSFEELAKPVKTGAAVLAIDEHGAIRASALASSYKDGAQGQNNLTEVGAVMCDVGGVGLAKIVVAMLSLKQNFDPKADSRVYAKVAQDNAASNKVFSSSLGWDAVDCNDHASTLYDVAYLASNGEGKRDRIWYHFTKGAQEKAAKILQTCVDEQALKTRDGSVIDLNVDGSSLWSTLHYYEMLAPELEQA